MGIDWSKQQHASQKKSLKVIVLSIVLLFCIMSSGLLVSYQVYSFRDQFQELQRTRKERQKLDEEWGRLLIEQQTFGAITQVGGRAVIRLHMYSPAPTQMVTIPMDMSPVEP